MNTESTFEFDTSALVSMEKEINWLDKESWTFLAAYLVLIAGMTKFATEIDKNSIFINSLAYAAENNTIFCAKKNDRVSALFFGEQGTVVFNYLKSGMRGSCEINTDFQAEGKMTVFIMGEFKASKVFDTFLHIDPERYANNLQMIGEKLVE